MQLQAQSTPADYWRIQDNGGDGIEFAYWDDSDSTETAYMTIGGNAGNVTFFNNLVLDQVNHLRFIAGLTADDSFRIDGGSGSDELRIYYNDNGTNTQLFNISSAGVLSYEADESSNYTNRSVVDKAYVDGKAPYQEPIMVIGPDSAITATTSEQDITCLLYTSPSPRDA